MGPLQTTWQGNLEMQLDRSPRDGQMYGRCTGDLVQQASCLTLKSCQERRYCCRCLGQRSTTPANRHVADEFALQSKQLTLQSLGHPWLSSLGTCSQASWLHSEAGYQLSCCSSPTPDPLSPIPALPWYHPWPLHEYTRQLSAGVWCSPDPSENLGFKKHIAHPLKPKNGSKFPKNKTSIASTSPGVALVVVSVGMLSLTVDESNIYIYMYIYGCSIKAASCLLYL